MPREPPVAKLIERYGDAKLPDLLQALAGCPKVRSSSIHDRCAVRFKACNETTEPNDRRHASRPWFGGYAAGGNETTNIFLSGPISLTSYDVLQWSEIRRARSHPAL